MSSDNSWILIHVDDSFQASVLGDKSVQLRMFADLDETIEHIFEDYLALVADAGELEPDQVEAARERFELLWEQYPQPEVFTEYINELTIDLRRILWFGSLAELAELHHEFANQVREFYWHNLAVADEDDPYAPVPEEEWPTLLEALAGYLSEGEF